MDQIYSLGDYEMLTNALQGVAMIFGTPSMANLASGGFTLGVIFICAQYVTSQRFNPHHILTGYLVYSVLFVPTTTVSVEDAYTNQVRTVAHVPIGVAAPMSIVSTIGLRMAKLFETAFSVPTQTSMVDNGYMDALTTLLKLRTAGIGTALSDGSANTDVANTLSNYIDACVMYDVQQNITPQLVSKASIMKAADLWGVLQTNFVNRDIIVALPDGSGTRQLNCHDAYNAIDAYIKSSTFTDVWYAYINGLLGYPDNSTSASSRVQNALYALNLTGVDAQLFMQNALVASFLRDGPSAFIQRPALEQLQMQWAGEDGIFKKMARPLMAFIETFTVAISPIAAFLVTMGPMGLSVAVKYLQLAAWVALWGPVMAICNMYIAIASSRAVAALAQQAQNTGADIGSMVMHDRLFQTLELWVSTGGMLAASAPLLALSLVYGGPIVANSLASRFMGGAKLTPEKSLAPDPVSVAPAMSVSTRSMMNSPTMAMTTTGVGQFSYDISATAKQSLSSARSAVNSASAQVASTQSRMLSGSATTGSRTVDGDSFTNSMAHSQGKQDVWAAQTAQSIAQGVTNNATEQKAIAHALTGALGASLTLGGRIPIIGGPAAEAALKSQLSATGQSGEDRVNSLASQASEQYSQVANNSDAYTQMKNYASSHANESVFSSEHMRQKAEQWASALNAQVTATEQFTKMASLEQVANMARPVKADELGYALGKFDNGQTNQAYIELMHSDPKVAEELTAAKVKAADGIRASGVTLPGEQFDLATKFLAINSVRPDKGVEIARNTVIPFEQGLDTGLKHDTFKTGLKPEDIVQPENAQAVQQKAGGNGEITTLWGRGDTGGPSETGNALHNVNVGSMPDSQQPPVAIGAGTLAPTSIGQQPGEGKSGSPGAARPDATASGKAAVSGKDTQHPTYNDVSQTTATGKGHASSKDDKLPAKLSDNGIVPVAGNHKGPALQDAPKAPSGWGDIIKNHVGKMPASPGGDNASTDHPVKDLHVPAADRVQELIGKKDLSKSLQNENEKISSIPNTNFENAMGIEAKRVYNELGGKEINNALGDLGKIVRDKVMSSPEDLKNGK